MFNKLIPRNLHGNELFTVANNLVKSAYDDALSQINIDKTGINLLREGLDIPECALVGILDADKEGFLRSERSLIQTIGRAARNVEGKAILYADKKSRI